MDSLINTLKTNTIGAVNSISENIPAVNPTNQVGVVNSINVSDVTAPIQASGNNFRNMFNFSFGSNKYVSGGKDFLESNSFVAKIAFVLLVIILFVFLLRVGIYLLSWIFSPSTEPVLIKHMIDAKQMHKIPQDPAQSGAIPILRSTNDPNGLEFTWSVWINIEDYTYKQNQYKHIFHKGNDNINLTGDSAGINEPNNAPGLYLTPHINNLLIKMNTFDNINEDILVKDVPLNKWVNVIIRVIQHQVDVYVNGSMVKRHILKGVPKQNYGEVFVTMNGGFSGHLSQLRYFNYAIGTNHIERIVSTGPNLNMITSDLSTGEPHYLSTKWYLNNSINTY